MSKVAIVIDSWKLEIFSTTLESKNYKYKKINNCPTKGVITLKVDVNNISDFEKLVAHMNTEAAKSKMN